jgi:metal-responsive CopG/Arc/MetJ family transcriptional regulator
MEKVKTQIVFSEDLIKRLDRVVKKKERSLFVTEAVEEKLKKLSLQKALAETAGIWSDREDLEKDAGAANYLKAMDESDRAREERLKRAWSNV